MSFYSFKLLVIGSVIASVSPAAGSQSRPAPADLFQQLGSADSSDRAANQIIRLGESDRQARTYIATHLSNLIEQNPHDNYERWDNAVRIAGELKIVQACPALEPWVGAQDVGPNETTLSDAARLLTDPAAKALSEIGEPAVPTLSELLHSTNFRARADAARALQIIGSPTAIASLRQHEPHETDANIRDFIDYVLASKGPSGP